MQINKVIYLLILAVILSGCSSMESEQAGAKTRPTESKVKAVQEPTENVAQAMIEQAEESRKQAAAVDSEWRDVGKLIKKAEAALKEGEYKKSIKFAKQAADQGELGYQQAVSQKELLIPSYMKPYMKN